MCWCIAESIYELDRALLSKSLVSLGTCKDESNNKIDIRFSATTLVKGKMQTRRGFLGRAQSFEGSSANDILNITARMFVTFATSFHGAPRHPKGLETKVGETLVEHM